MFHWIYLLWIRQVMIKVFTVNLNSVLTYSLRCFSILLILARVLDNDLCISRLF